MKDRPEVRASMANLGVEEQYIGFRLGQMQDRSMVLPKHSRREAPLCACSESGGLPAVSNL